jgi:hypothetical protein
MFLPKAASSMKFSLFPVRIGFAVAASMLFPLNPAHAETLYELRFEKDGKQSSENTGSVGGDFIVEANTNPLSSGEGFLGAHTAEVPPTAGNKWAYELPSNGILGAFLTLPDSSDKLRLTDDGDEMTIAMWVWLNGDPQRVDGLVANQSSREAAAGWAFFVDPKTSKLALSFANPEVVKDYAVTRSYRDEQLVPVKKWTHLAVVYKNNIASFFIDGSIVGSSAPFGCVPAANNLPIRVGMQLEVSSPIDGKVDNVVISNSALSEAEIERLAERVP